MESSFDGFAERPVNIVSLRSRSDVTFVWRPALDSVIGLYVAAVQTDHSIVPS
jgi:hypothetical protein